MRRWLRGFKKTEVDQGIRVGVPTEVAAQLKALERENRALRQGKEDQAKVRGTFAPTNEILGKASAYFAQAEQARGYWRPFKR